MMGPEAPEQGSTGNVEADPHTPYVRHVVLSGHPDRYGQWVPDLVDEHTWELICRECGDNEGLAEAQTRAVRSLRGSYPSRHKAEHAARHHSKEFGGQPFILPAITDRPRP
jgi:hypothetical protein